MGVAEVSGLFNFRHKIALCATLVCVGLIVLFDGGVRAAVGIGLLGIAFSWAFGSNYRIVHWLFVVFGVLLLVPPIWDGVLWHRNKPEIIKDDASIVESDEEAIVNDQALIQLDIERPDKEAQRKDEKALAKDNDDLREARDEMDSDQSEGIFRHVLKRDWGAVIGGLLLLAAGIGLVVGTKSQRARPSNVVHG